MKDRNNTSGGDEMATSPMGTKHHGNHRNPLPPPSFPPSRPDDPNRHPPAPPHHDHRFNRMPLGGAGGEGEDGAASPREAADINLLANSLSTRLRKSSRRHRAATTASSSASTSSGATALSTAGSSGGGSRSAPPPGQDAVRKAGSKSGPGIKRDAYSQQPAPPPQQQPHSILKRTLSREMAEQQYLYLLEHRAGSRGSEEDFHLPDVFLTQQHWSSSSGQLDHFGTENEGVNNQLLDRPSPTVTVFRGAAAGGGSRTHTSNGHITWVKRAGIFQPADKYATGRQNLHGEDQPFARSQPVNYETVTLASRSESPADSDTTSGWSSGKSERRKGLKVSWKQAGDPEEEQEEDLPRADTSTSRSGRQKSAGTMQSEREGGGAAFSFVKPKFNPGKSRVPGVGVRWNVPTPSVGRSPQQGEGAIVEDEGTQRPYSGDANPSRCCSSVSTSSLPAPATAASHPSKATSRDTRHPWRALHARHDVHPVTTAMEREGTSVSKTKWQVPSLRPVPAYTFLEDYVESSAGHLLLRHPGMTQSGRLATRATLDAQSMQIRVKEDLAESSKDTTASSGCTSTGSVATGDKDPQTSSRS